MKRLAVPFGAVGPVAVLYAIDSKATPRGSMMKHASDTTLDQLDRLLDQLRLIEGLKERKRGVFYRGAAAFLHFHEDPEGLFADVRLDDAWGRIAVNTAAERRRLLAKIKAALR
jgi:hypothetical protein